MISTSPLDTARRATSSCPGSPLAPVSGIGPGTESSSGPTVGAAVEVADSSPAAAAVVVGPVLGCRRGRRFLARLRSRRRRARGGCRRGRRFLARIRSRRRRRDLRTCRGLWQRDGERRFRRAHPRPTSRKIHRRRRSLRAGVNGTPTGKAGRGGGRPLPRVPVEDGGGDDHVGLGGGVVRPWRVDRIDEARRRLQLHRRRRGHTVGTRALDHRRINRQHRRACHVVERVGVASRSCPMSPSIPAAADRANQPPPHPTSPSPPPSAPARTADPHRRCR